MAFRAFFYPTMVGGFLIYNLYNRKSNIIACSPTFEGIPVSATLIIFQAVSHFQKHYPGLEISASFSPGKAAEHFYKEEGGFLGLFPTRCVVGIPVFEKLDELEESRLGQALLMKPIVGHLVLEGKCKMGCASATLSSLSLYRVDSQKKPNISAKGLIWALHF
jgi:hypothetical protein